jgi:hypothetical protein
MPVRTLIVFSFLAAGCYQEDLPQIDIAGKVVVSRGAATRTVPTVDADGVLTGVTELTDIRLLGPLYLAAYSGMDNTSFSFPYPAMGPVIGGDPGNSFPYGATSVGRFDFACYSDIACKVTTGRFKDYNDVLDYFANVLANPITDEHGVRVTSSSAFQQACYDYFYVTSDEELSFIGADQFTENADGDFEADFLMPHTTYVEGMAIWGFVDAPVIDTASPSQNGVLTTCDLNAGRNRIWYDQDFYEGAPHEDITNIPGYYLATGDWVSDGTSVMTSADDQPTVYINIPVEEE